MKAINNNRDNQIRLYQIRSYILYISLTLLINWTSTSLFANEAPSAEATNEKSGAGEDRAQVERNKEWSELINNINSLSAKIKSKEDSIKEIIHHKQSAKDKEEIAHAVNNLIQEHKELIKLEDEYNSQTQLLKYNYPDVGITNKRRYEKMKIKSIEEYEENESIGFKVKKAVLKAKRHYGYKEEDKNEEKSKKKNNLFEDPNNLAQPIILKK